MTITPEPLDRDPSGLFARAKAGDQTAWEELFHECYPKVIRVVRRKLDRPMRSLYDSTDFANDVMKSLAANVDRLDFPTIGQLLSFLAQAAEQKVIDEYRRRHTLKRDIKREQALGVTPDDGLRPIASHDPTASQLAQAREVHDQLMDRDDESERVVIELRRQGYSTAEIAEKTGWSARKVQRFLKELQDHYRGSGVNR